LQQARGLFLYETAMDVSAWSWKVAINATQTERLFVVICFYLLHCAPQAGTSQRAKE
jgi:hypothetical protein